MQKDTLALALVLGTYVQSFPQRPSNMIHYISFSAYQHISFRFVPTIAFYSHTSGFPRCILWVDLGGLPSTSGTIVSQIHYSDHFSNKCLFADTAIGGRNWLVQFRTPKLYGIIKVQIRISVIKGARIAVLGCTRNY